MYDIYIDRISRRQMPARRTNKGSFFPVKIYKAVKIILNGVPRGLFFRTISKSGTKFGEIISNIKSGNRAKIFLYRFLSECNNIL